ncbi:hypothetical protein JJL45_09210 [Tamlana sp. s12]|uniref:hypothetical protein n=1 Tax=Tamlana sp. s12 TaxID=1630406 RepID=UPI0008002862|nr:hypothetical protein [Tamlana sp. s12]OBQ52866.1 hypothetical protein VQ01_13035 [Tamlana sp. s12]QQY81108.1 hypothetical protein JJL45_09210 [Tamlana sp. s12]
MNKNVELPHYALNGLFDFLRSDEQIEAAKIRQQNRLDTREDAALDRQETRLEVGEIRRDTKVLKQEIRQDNVANGAGTLVGNLLASWLTPKTQTTTSTATIPYAGNTVISTETPKTDMAGAYILGAIAFSVFLGAIALKKSKPKENEPISSEKKLRDSNKKN